MNKILVMTRVKINFKLGAKTKTYDKCMKTYDYNIKIVYAVVEYIQHSYNNTLCISLNICETHIKKVQKFLLLILFN